MALLDRLARLQLIVVTGKGGVGKTTLTVALGRILSDAGRRALLLEADPRESLHHLLDVPPSDGEIVEVGTRLWALNLTPQHVIDDLVRDRLKLGFLSERVLASPIYQHFTAAAPGLKEMALLGFAHRSVAGPAGERPAEVDVVVLDAPASGHGVSLLEAPILVSEVLREGPVAKLGSELAGFVADPQRCGVVIVTAAEEMPIRETIELIESLDRRLHRRPELVAVNGTYPPLVDAAAQGDDPVLALWRERRGVNEAELNRLLRAWEGPSVELPLMPLEGGPELVAAMIQVLGRAVTDPSTRSHE